LFSPRQTIAAVVADRGLSLADLSVKIGRNHAYLQQYVKRGSPRRLPEKERRHLAMALEIDERRLGARDPWMPAPHAAS
jgi:cyanate lyase